MADITPTSRETVKKQVEIYLNRDVSAVFDDQKTYAHNKVVRFSNILVGLDNFITNFWFVELERVVGRDGVDLDWDSLDESQQDQSRRNAVFKYESTLSGFKFKLHAHTDEDGDVIKTVVELDEKENDLRVFLKQFQAEKDGIFCFEYDMCFGYGIGWENEGEWQETQTLIFDDSGESPQLIYRGEHAFHID